MKKLCGIILCTLVFNTSILTYAHAEAPYQFSFIYPIQLVKGLEDIKGVRFNMVYGVNNDVTGIDFGAINQVDGIQRGLQFGFFNSSFKTIGVQLGIINKTEYLNGIQIGLLNIHSEGNLKFLPGINFSF